MDFAHGKVKLRSWKSLENMTESKRKYKAKALRVRRDNIVNTIVNLLETDLEIPIDILVHLTKLVVLLHTEAMALDGFSVNLMLSKTDLTNEKELKFNNRKTYYSIGWLLFFLPKHIKVKYFDTLVEVSKKLKEVK